MIKSYSQRMLPPFTGFVQIAESEMARAQSFDGISWEIQYLAGNKLFDSSQKRGQGYPVERSYFKVASLHNHQLKPFILPSCLDPEEVTGCIDELAEFLATAKLPFPAADVHEYWLLDAADDSPLALIFSCCDESQTSTYPARAQWTAIPHSKMKIENTAEEKARGVAPVNHRVQDLVAARAGGKPRAAWVERRHDDADDYRSLLVREDWEDQSSHELFQRYLARKAPRLLMLQGLSHANRDRLEIAAKSHVAEVDQYYPMYPEVIDQRRMSSILVEARLRRDLPQGAAVKEKAEKPAHRPLSKELRILE
jgi:hypothetical protein